MSSVNHDISEEVVHISNLSISFGDNHVLKSFNMRVGKGENVVVLGKSGSGKSVLIKCIIGLLQADAGSIQVLNEEVTTIDGRRLDDLRAKVGFLFQSNALYDSMTIRENLEFRVTDSGKDCFFSNNEAKKMAGILSDHLFSILRITVSLCSILLFLLQA